MLQETRKRSGHLQHTHKGRESIQKSSKTAKLRLTRAHFEHQFMLMLEERGPATYLVVEGRPLLS